MTDNIDFAKKDDKLVLDGVSFHWVKSDRRRAVARKARVYVWGDENFNVLEDLQNRTRRPYVAWRAIAVEALKKIGITNVKLRWSQLAGCSCPCSPGFVVEEAGDFSFRNGDLFIKVHAPIPTVDESKPSAHFTI